MPNWRKGFHGPQRWRRRGGRRAAATSIQKAWRRRARRRAGGLVTRTVKANRRDIKSIKRSIEINMIEDVQATIGNRYGGQWLEPTQVSDLGEDPTPLPLVMRPLHGISRGAASTQRNGDKIKMTSLTYRVQFTATTGLLADTHNFCGMFVVHDSNPAANATAPNLMGAAGTGTSNDGTLLAGQGPLAYQKFLALKNVGKNKRYKVLKHHKVFIQPVAATSVGRPQALINHTLKLPYLLQYPAAPSVVNSPLNQDLYFFFYSSSGAAPSPEVSCYCRVRYRDA